MIFAYQPTIGFWPIVCASLTCVIIAFGTANYQAIKAALVNPADDLVESMINLMRIFAFAFTLLLGDRGHAQSLQEYYTSAKEAYQNKDYTLFYSQISEANKLHPYHQGILYYKGIAAALTNKPDEAMACLRKAVLINHTYELQLEDLKSLMARKDFQALLNYQRDVKTPIVQSDTAFILSERDLHAEAIAVNPTNGEFFIASIHKRKIVKVDTQGKASDFTTSGQDGLTAVMSLKIDQKTNTLWVTSSPLPEMLNFDSTSRSALYAYDLKTGKLKASYEPNHPAGEFVLGDLVLNGFGDVFVSDTKNNIIFLLNTKTKKLEPFYTSEEFWNIQGITFSDDGRFLFISDYIKGIFRLDLLSKSLIALSIVPDLSLKGVDGLLFYKNSLIAIQNGISPMRVTRYSLNSELDTIISVQHVDRDHPAFNEPTNGCIANNTFFYVANSQWAAYDEDRNLKSMDQLQDIVILKKVLD